MNCQWMIQIPGVLQKMEGKCRERIWFSKPDQWDGGYPPCLMGTIQHVLNITSTTAFAIRQVLESKFQFKSQLSWPRTLIGLFFYILFMCCATSCSLWQMIRLKWSLCQNTCGKSSTSMWWHLHQSFQAHSWSLRTASSVQWWLSRPKWVARPFAGKEVSFLWIFFTWELIWKLNPCFCQLRQAFHARMAFRISCSDKNRQMTTYAVSRHGLICLTAFNALDLSCKNCRSQTASVQKAAAEILFNATSKLFINSLNKHVKHEMKLST